MAIALVGSRGTATQGAASAAVTPSWGTSENRVAGNLLVCTVTVTAVATLPTTPSGWSIAAQVAGTSCSATVYYKVAAGSDAAPTIAAITSGVIAAQLSEYSGADPSAPLDEFGTQTGTSSPITETLPGVDQATGELLIAAGSDRRSVSRATNDTWTSNSGTPTLAGSNNGTSSKNHYSFAALVGTNQNAVADTAVMTLSITTSITGLAVAAATFRQAVQKSASDSGTGTDAVSSLDAHLDATDSGAGTDTASVTTPPVSVSASDSGTGTDAVASVGVYGSQESGVGTDASSRVGIASSESGTGTDASSRVGLQATDSGSSTETSGVGIATSESGSGSDLASGISLGTSESGAGSDAASLASSLASSESGSGTDLLSSLSLPGHGDAAAGSEAATLAASLSGTQESATGTDLASLAVQAGASESGVASESATVTVQVSTSDSGAGSDGSSPPGVQVAASESAAATDLATVDAGGAKSATEAGTGSDLASLSVQVTASESGTATEAASVAETADAVGSESGTATEGATVTVRIDATDSGSGLESFGDLLALLQGSDSAIAAELASVRTGPLVIRPGISTREGPVLGTGLSDHGHPPTVHEGPTVGTTIADQGTGGRATDGPRLTVGVDDG